MPDYPDLQELAAKYGGLSGVPPEEWAKHDRAVRKWNERYRDGLEKKGMPRER